ncbi:hypothetical protein AB1E18_007181 [Capra hircus]
MAQHFSLAACDVVGFDLDHTLCCYNLPESARLIYNSFAQFLVKEKGYDKGLLTVTPEDWDFCCKGLALDLEDGNFIKLADNGTVLRASHGTKMLSPEALAAEFGRKEWKHFMPDTGMAFRSGKYYFYDNYFDLPGALLCARVVDSLTKNNGQKPFDFWKDIVAGIQHNYKMSAFKEALDVCSVLPGKPGFPKPGAPGSPAEDRLPRKRKRKKWHLIGKEEKGKYRMKKEQNKTSVHMISALRGVQSFGFSHSKAGCNRAWPALGYTIGEVSPCQRIFRQHYHMPLDKQWHPTPVLLPGKSHGWRSLVGCSPWGR